MSRFVLSLVATAMLISTTALSVAKEPEFVSLFDGGSLKGWHGYKKADISKSWSVDDKAIFCNGEKGADLVTDKQYENFELRFEWKISTGGDSGLVYRISETPKEARQSGPEYQILDDKTVAPKTPTTASASLYALYGAEEKGLKPVGDFNVAKIVVRGNHIQHWLNETKVVDCNINSEDWNKKVAASELSEWKGFAKIAKGHIALQNAGTKVWFRNITIKELEIEEEEEG